MNIYEVLNNLLNDATTYDFQDKVISAAIRVAKLDQNETRINNQVLERIIALQNENTLLKQISTKLLTENQNLKANVMGLEGNQVPENLQISQSNVTPGGMVVETEEVNQPLTVRNEGFQTTPAVSVTQLGVQHNSPINTK